MTTTGTVRVGRWTYGATRADGVVTYERRDAHATIVTADAKVAATFTPAPSPAKTPNRCVRVPEDLWAAAQAAAADRGDNLSAVIREALAAYVAA